MLSTGCWRRWMSKNGRRSRRMEICAIQLLCSYFFFMVYSSLSERLLLREEKKHFLEIWVMSAFTFCFLWEEVLWHFGKLFQRQVRGAGWWCGQFVSVEATVLNNVQHIFLLAIPTMWKLQHLGLSFYLKTAFWHQCLQKLAGHVINIQTVNMVVHCISQGKILSNQK